MPRNIREYEVFRLSHKMVLEIYSVTKKFPQDERYSLTSQIKRSAYSIPMNLIEGGAKRTEAEFRRFVDIAVGSCAEMEYQLELCRDLKFLTIEQYDFLAKQYTSIGKMLNKLMQKLNER